MLRANVGLSRKISRDYQSTGYTLNLEGEILAPVDDTEAVQERINELFSLAEEALNQEIERDQGEQAIGRRDEEPPRPANDKPKQPEPAEPGTGPQTPAKATNGKSNGDEGATNKQCQYLLNLANRQGLSTKALDAKIETIVGRPSGVYQLTKREAGQVIDALTGNGAKTNGQR